MKTWQEKIKNKKQEIERLKKQVPTFRTIVFFFYFICCNICKFTIHCYPCAVQIDYLAENAEQQKVVLQEEKANLITMEKQVKESKEKLEKVCSLNSFCKNGC